MTTQIRGNKQIKDISITNEQIAQDARIETTKLAEGAELFKRDGSVAATGNINLNSHQIKNVSAPSDDTDAVRKVDLDTSVSNLQSDIDSLDVRVGDLEAHDVVQDGRLDNIEAKDIAQDGRLSTIEAKDIEQDNRLSSVESKNTQQDNRLAQAEADIAALEAADVVADTRLSNLEDGLQAETTARQAAVSNLQSQIDAFHVEEDLDIAAVEARVTAAEADIVQLQNNLAEATNGAFITREVPSGVIDGSNRVFTLAFSPNVGSEQVFVNGNLLNPGAQNDYTINDTVITFAVAPEAGDVVFANYIHDAIIVGTGSGSGGSGGATNLNGLTDVTITSPAVDQVLKYNGSQWVNAEAPAGSSFSGSYNDLTNKPSLFSGSYNDLTNKPDVASLENRVSSLESSVLVTREVPVGSIDGVNAVFTLASSPVVGSEQVFLNGLLQEAGNDKDYTISGRVITFSSAPEVGWKLSVNYATGNGAFAGSSGSSGAIEVFQDEEFNWPASGRTFRTITHNKGRRPDMIKVFYKPDGVTWAGMIDYMTSNQNYGWIEWSDVADPNNQVKISIDSSALGGGGPVRIRLYWFGSEDIGTASAGSFTVGGGSSAPSVYESDVVTVPYYGLAQINHTQEFVHNLGYKPTNIQVVVDDTNVSTNPYYSDPGVVLPTASNFWGVSHILGFVAQHLDVNRMIIRFYFMGQQSETKVRVRCS